MQVPLAATLLVLAGCQSVPPGAAKPVDPASLLVPASAWQSEPAAQAAPVPAAFWSEFNSPTLDALVAEGLAASPTLQAAARRVSAAAATLEAAAGADLPTVQASLASSRSRVNFVGFPIPGSSGVLTSESTSFGLSLGVSWELDLWGRLASAERGAAASLDAQSLDLVAAQQSLAAQIAKGAFALAEARAGEELAAEASANAEGLLENARRLLNSGSGRSEDVLAAEAALAQARAQESQAAQRTAVLGPPLAVLLGRASGRDSGLTEAELDSLTAELRRGPLPAAPDPGLPAELLARRPDLASLEARVRASQAGAEVARAALFPSLSLTGSAGTAGNELQNLVDGDFKVWSLGANLLAPLFTGGALRAQEQRAIAERDAALFAFAQAALVAFAEVDSALVSETLTQARIAQLTTWRDKLRDAESLFENKSRRGTAPSAAVFAARAQRIGAETQLLAARRELFTTRIDLYLALGGGFLSSTPAHPES